MLCATPVAEPTPAPPPGADALAALTTTGRVLGRAEPGALLEVYLGARRSLFLSEAQLRAHGALHPCPAAPPEDPWCGVRRPTPAEWVGWVVLALLTLGAAAAAGVLVRRNRPLPRWARVW